MHIVIQIVFFLLAALILGSALLVVIARNIIHAALWLIVSFFCVAALYLLLHAEFLAIVQVLVYIGAISILVLFAIMLTRHITNTGEHQLYKYWWVGLIVSGGLFAGVLVPTLMNHPWQTSPHATAISDEAIANAVTLGKAFMGEYLLPFEVASIVLLVALIGAVVVTFEERASRRRVLTLAEKVSLRQQQRLDVHVTATAEQEMADGV